MGKESLKHMYSSPKERSRAVPYSCTVSPSTLLPTVTPSSESQMLPALQSSRQRRVLLLASSSAKSFRNHSNSSRIETGHSLSYKEHFLKTPNNVFVWSRAEKMCSKSLTSGKTSPWVFAVIPWVADYRSPSLQNFLPSTTFSP